MSMPGLNWGNLSQATVDAPSAPSKAPPTSGGGLDWSSFGKSSPQAPAPEAAPRALEKPVGQPLLYRNLDSQPVIHPQFSNLEGGFKGTYDSASAMQAALNDARKQGLNLTLKSGMRTNAEQADLRAKLGDMAALPGHSMHERGSAYDVSGDLDKFAPIAEKHGFARPYNDPASFPHEPWHFSYQPEAPTGSRERMWGNDDPRLQAAASSRAQPGSIQKLGESMASQYGFDHNTTSILMRQIKQESGWDPAALSPAGAMGLPQFMPGTLAPILNKLGYTADDYHKNPSVQLRTYFEYMQDSLKQHNGDLAQTLAAYNAGEGGAQHIRAGEHWPETSSYVQHILGLPDQATADSMIRNGGPKAVQVPQQDLEYRTTDALKKSLSSVLDTMGLGADAAWKKVAPTAFNPLNPVNAVRGAVEQHTQDVLGYHTPVSGEDKNAWGGDATAYNQGRDLVEFSKDAVSGLASGLNHIYEAYGLPGSSVVGAINKQIDPSQAYFKNLEGEYDRERGVAMGNPNQPVSAGQWGSYTLHHPSELLDTKAWQANGLQAVASLPKLAGAVVAMTLGEAGLARAAGALPGIGPAGTTLASFLRTKAADLLPGLGNTLVKALPGMGVAASQMFTQATGDALHEGQKMEQALQEGLLAAFLGTLLGLGMHFGLPLAMKGAGRIAGAAGQAGSAAANSPIGQGASAAIDKALNDPNGPIRMKVFPAFTDFFQKAVAKTSLGRTLNDAYANISKQLKDVHAAQAVERTSTTLQSEAQKNFKVGQAVSQWKQGIQKLQADAGGRAKATADAFDNWKQTNYWALDPEGEQARQMLMNMDAMKALNTKEAAQFLREAQAPGSEFNKLIKKFDAGQQQMLGLGAEYENTAQDAAHQYQSAMARLPQEMVPAVDNYLAVTEFWSQDLYQRSQLVTQMPGYIQDPHAIEAVIAHSGPLDPKIGDYLNDGINDLIKQGQSLLGAGMMPTRLQQMVSQGTKAVLDAFETHQGVEGASSSLTARLGHIQSDLTSQLQELEAKAPVKPVHPDEARIYLKGSEAKKDLAARRAQYQTDLADYNKDATSHQAEVAALKLRIDGIDKALAPAYQTAGQSNVFENLHNADAGARQQALEEHLTNAGVPGKGSEMYEHLNTMFNDAQPMSKEDAFSAYRDVAKYNLKDAARKLGTTSPRGNFVSEYSTIKNGVARQKLEDLRDANPDWYENNKAAARAQAYKDALMDPAVMAAKQKASGDMNSPLHDYIDKDIRPLFANNEDFKQVKVPAAWLDNSRFSPSPKTDTLRENWKAYDERYQGPDSYRGQNYGGYKLNEPVLLGGLQKDALGRDVLPVLDGKSRVQVLGEKNQALVSAIVPAKDWDGILQSRLGEAYQPISNAVDQNKLAMAGITGVDPKDFGVNSANTMQEHFLSKAQEHWKGLDQDTKSQLVIQELSNLSNNFADYQNPSAKNLDYFIKDANGNPLPSSSWARGFGSAMQQALEANMSFKQSLDSLLQMKSPGSMSEMLGRVKNCFTEWKTKHELSKTVSGAVGQDFSNRLKELMVDKGPTVTNGKGSLTPQFSERMVDAIESMAHDRTPMQSLLQDHPWVQEPMAAYFDMISAMEKYKVSSPELGSLFNQSVFFHRFPRLQSMLSSTAKNKPDFSFTQMASENERNIATLADARKLYGEAASKIQAANWDNLKAAGPGVVGKSRIPSSTDPIDAKIRYFSDTTNDNRKLLLPELEDHEINKTWMHLGLKDPVTDPAEIIRSHIHSVIKTDSTRDLLTRLASMPHPEMGMHTAENRPWSVLEHLPQGRNPVLGEDGRPILDPTTGEPQMTRAPVKPPANYVSLSESWLSPQDRLEFMGEPKMAKDLYMDRDVHNLLMNYFVNDSPTIAGKVNSWLRASSLAATGMPHLVNIYMMQAAAMAGHSIGSIAESMAKMVKGDFAGGAEQLGRGATNLAMSPFTGPIMSMNGGDLAKNYGLMLDLALHGGNMRAFDTAIGTLSQEAYSKFKASGNSLWPNETPPPQTLGQATQNFLKPDLPRSWEELRTGQALGLRSTKDLVAAGVGEAGSLLKSWEKFSVWQPIQNALVGSYVLWSHLHFNDVGQRLVDSMVNAGATREAAVGMALKAVKQEAAQMVNRLSGAVSTWKDPRWARAMMYGTGQAGAMNQQNQAVAGFQNLTSGLSGLAFLSPGWLRTSAHVLTSALPDGLQVPTFSGAAEKTGTAIGNTLHLGEGMGQQLNPFNEFQHLSPEMSALRDYHQAQSRAQIGALLAGGFTATQVIQWMLSGHSTFQNDPSDQSAWMKNRVGNQYFPAHYYGALSPFMSATQGTLDKGLAGGVADTMEDRAQPLVPAVVHALENRDRFGKQISYNDQALPDALQRARYAVSQTMNLRPLLGNPYHYQTGAERVAAYLGYDPSKATTADERQTHRMKQATSRLWQAVGNPKDIDTYLNGETQTEKDAALDRISNAGEQGINLSPQEMQDFVDKGGSHQVDPERGILKMSQAEVLKRLQGIKKARRIE